LGEIFGFSGFFCDKFSSFLVSDMVIFGFGFVWVGISFWEFGVPT
jgi:hypothetical protein